MPNNNVHSIILFDGVCNLCIHSVQFIIKRDPNAYFKFASLQSDSGNKLARKFGVDTTQPLTTMVLIENNKAYFESTAALKICKNLNRLWPAMRLLLIMPPILRNLAYRLIGKNRYRWFGKLDQCWIPTKTLQQRFLNP